MAPYWFLKYCGRTWAKRKLKKSAYKSTNGLRARRRKRRVRIVVVFSILAVLLLLGLVGLSWLPMMRITSIEVKGTVIIPVSAVHASAEKILSGTYFFVLPRNNVLLYPKQEIAQGIRTQFSALQSVSVRMRDFHTMAIQVVERGPKALWCGDAVVSSSACFMLDPDGLAYASAVDFAGTAYVRYFGILSGEQLPKQYLSANDFRALSALVDELAKKSGAVLRVAVDEHKDVRVSFANGFDLLFVLSDSGSDILDRYTLALTAAPFSGRTLSDFLYLDLRFGDKLYYKLR